MFSLLHRIRWFFCPGHQCFQHAEFEFLNRYWLSCWYLIVVENYMSVERDCTQNFVLPSKWEISKDPFLTISCIQIYAPFLKNGFLIFVYNFPFWAPRLAPSPSLHPRPLPFHFPSRNLWLPRPWTSLNTTPCRHLVQYGFSFWRWKSVIFAQKRIYGYW